VQLRRFRQLLALGGAEDDWVEPAVGESPPGTPFIAEAEDVWANDQRLTALVLGPARPAAEVLAALPVLRTRLDSVFRVYTRLRMYQSQANEALRDTLRATAGFALLLPKLYRLERLDSTYVFRNWTNVGGELRRTVAVTWRKGVDSTTSNQTLLSWRDAATRTYGHPQNIEREPLRRRRITRGDLVGFEVQGAWKANFDGLPAGGPFITRMVPCPAQDRTYLLDAWLYAPARQKYEYMIQLEILLNTFRCGSAPAPTPK
jgi:hypothetical protein